MSGKIYLRDPDGGLRGMTEAHFDSENLMQQLIADYSDLLTGDQMNTASPCRRLLVDREPGLPDLADGSDW